MYVKYYLLMHYILFTMSNFVGSVAPANSNSWVMLSKNHFSHFSVFHDRNGEVTELSCNNQYCYIRMQSFKDKMHYLLDLCNECINHLLKICNHTVDVTDAKNLKGESAERIFSYSFRTILHVLTTSAMTNRFGRIDSISARRS